MSQTKLGMILMTALLVTCVSIAVVSLVVYATTLHPIPGRIV